MLIRSINSASVDRNYQKSNMANNSKTNNSKTNNTSSLNVTFGYKYYNGYKFPSGIYYYADIYIAKLEMQLYDTDVKKWRERIFKNELVNKFSLKDCFTKKPDQYLDQIEKLIKDIKQNPNPKEVKLESHSEFCTSKFF